MRIALNDEYIKLILADKRYVVTNEGKLLTRISVNGAGLMPNNKWREVGKIDNHGYRVFEPRINGKKVYIKVHRAIYHFFNGDLCPEKVINHIDGVRANNMPKNLEQVTWKYNSNYKPKTNT